MTTVAEDLVSVVGSALGGRLFANIAPANAAFPYGVYSLITAVPTQSLAGHIPPTNWTYQIDLFSPQKSVVETLARTIRSTMNSSTAFASTCTMQMDDYEPDAKLYRVTLDFSIWKVDE